MIRPEPQPTRSRKVSFVEVRIIINENTWAGKYFPISSQGQKQETIQEIKGKTNQENNTHDGNDRRIRRRYTMDFTTNRSKFHSEIQAVKTWSARWASKHRQMTWIACCFKMFDSDFVLASTSFRMPIRFQDEWFWTHSKSRDGQGTVQNFS